MEENKIVEGNEKIAGLLDMRPNHSADHGATEYGWTNTNWPFEDPPPFHYSWDWLMMAVEKIESLPHHDRPDFNYVVTIESGYCVISDNGEAPIAEAQWDGPKIDLVWHCVVEFIHWHTTNKH